MFVLVRNDLSKSQQGVQGGHALAQFMLDYPDLAQEWNNRTIVYLKADFQVVESLEKILPDNVLIDGISSFKEPDIGDQLTAIAVYGDGAEEYFANFKLM
jgi:hypothetical protein